MATLDFHEDEAIARLQKRVGNVLARMADLFVENHQENLNISNPAPDYPDSSIPGEYPRARSGFGRSTVMYKPDSPEEMGQEGRVRLGYSTATGENSKTGNYMLDLELNRGRLGLVKTLEALMPRLKILARKL